MKNPNLYPIGKPANAPLPSPATNSRQTRMEIEPSRDQVARKAYFIYLSQGSLQGNDVQHWLEAEALVIASRNVSRQNIPARV
jgi:hypothetical protein